jgi:hypothetical protein
MRGTVCAGLWLLLPIGVFLVPRWTPVNGMSPAEPTIGTDDEMAHSSLRFGIGRFTTEAEIDLAVELLEKHVKR